MNADKDFSILCKKAAPTPPCEPRTDMKVHVKHGKKQEREAL